jgi:hypothetical protein
VDVQKVAGSAQNLNGCETSVLEHCLGSVGWMFFLLLHCKDRAKGHLRQKRITLARQNAPIARQIGTPEMSNFGRYMDLPIDTIENFFPPSAASVYSAVLMPRHYLANRENVNLAASNLHDHWSACHEITLPTSLCEQLALADSHYQKNYSALYLDNRERQRSFRDIRSNSVSKRWHTSCFSRQQSLYGQTWDPIKNVRQVCHNAVRPSLMVSKPQTD